jgi:hypothetical protein
MPSSHFALAIHKQDKLDHRRRVGSAGICAERMRDRSSAATPDLHTITASEASQATPFIRMIFLG